MATYTKFQNSRPYKINVVYPPQKTEPIKEDIPLLVKQKSVKDIVSIFEKEKVLPIEDDSIILDTEPPITGIAFLKKKLQNISRYKNKNK